MFRPERAETPDPVEPPERVYRFPADDDLPPIIEIDVPPEESGIPPGPFDALAPVEQLASDIGLGIFIGDTVYVSDPTGFDMLFSGWYDPNLSPYERREARQAFYHYMGWNRRDFPWENWKEHYAQIYGHSMRT